MNPRFGEKFHLRDLHYSKIKWSLSVLLCERYARDEKIMRCDHSNFWSVSEGINLGTERSVLFEDDAAELTSRVRKDEAGRRGWDTRVKPARNIIFRQMCGRGREIIAPARSSWSSVRKCGRIIIVADIHAAPVRSHSPEMIMTEGQSQGRRKTSPRTTCYVTRKNTFSPSQHPEYRQRNSRLCFHVVREIRVLYIKRELPPGRGPVS